MPRTCQYKNQSCHGTDNDGINKRPRHGDEPLFGGFLCLCRRRSDRRRAETRLVREHAACDAVLHGHHDGRAGESARRRRARERTVEDECECRRDLADVHEDDPHTDDDVEHRHKGDDTRGDLGDAAQPADGDCGDEHGECDVSHHTRDAEGELHGINNGVDLRECADAEEGDEDGRHGKEARERAILLAHAAPNVVHRTACNLAVFIGRTVLDGEQPLRILRRHAEERRHPHPEDGTGAADLDRCRDTDDVARADGRCERDAQRLEA